MGHGLMCLIQCLYKSCIIFIRHKESNLQSGSRIRWVTMHIMMYSNSNYRLVTNVWPFATLSKHAVQLLPRYNINAVSECLVLITDIVVSNNIINLIFPQDTAPYVYIHAIHSKVILYKPRVYIE